MKREELGQWRAWPERAWCIVEHAWTVVGLPCQEGASSAKRGGGEARGQRVCRAAGGCAGEVAVAAGLPEMHHEGEESSLDCCPEHCWSHLLLNFLLS